MGDMERLRGEPKGVDGRGRSMRGIAGTDKPRIVKGESSEIEPGESVSRVPGSGISGGLKGDFEGAAFGLGETCSSVSLLDRAANGFVTPRASSWAGESVSTV